MAKINALARLCALFGGALLLATALMVVTSVILTVFFKSNVKGDFEMVQTANALAIFAFLPLATLNKSHVFVDTFTQWLPQKITLAIDALWQLLMAGFCLFMAWGLMKGAFNAFASNTKSMVLAYPLSPAIFLASLLIGLTGLVGVMMLFKGDKP